MVSKSSYKIIFLGDSDVGKSALHSGFAGRRYTPQATVRLEFAFCNVKIDGKSIFVELWDTAGMERIHDAIAKSYYRKAHGALLVFDLTNPVSLLNIETWLDKCEMNATGPLWKVLVGNKTDSLSRAVRPETANRRGYADDPMQEYAVARGIKYFETSANDVESIQKAIHCLVKLIDDAETESNPEVPRGETVDLSAEATAGNNSSSCICYY
ncbi:P-loop containing nucleoside triphosphate hydrolase protein [Auriculariales sp. MPI-PUGE-AT-0066]|nr:P-loop containing nucleoside triphosphate hydrolase protein [Auriculariales sp. MPI-PUGE-AT-0066]